jgi:hypothetical protein
MGFELMISLAGSSSGYGRRDVAGSDRIGGSVQMHGEVDIEWSTFSEAECAGVP